VRKFVNHIDHVAWVSRPENLEANVAKLEVLADVRLERFVREDMGFIMYVNWEAGLEIVSPTAEPTEFNKALRDRLETHGEGITAVVYGVRDLEERKARLERLGYPTGPLMDDHVDSPWHHKLVLRERVAGEYLGSWFILGDIDYVDGVIPLKDTRAAD
jgi:hypothetical protein